MNEDLLIRPMLRHECDQLVEWAKEEGWNPGLHDAEIFWQTDPEGFIAAEIQGELIGGGTVVAYEQNYGFMGLFIMKPDFRNQGLGRQLWHWRRNHLKSRLNEKAAVGMDGVVAMESFYAKGGFVKSHQNRRYQFLSKKRNLEVELIDAQQIDFQQLQQFDRQHFPADRATFLRLWIEQSKSHSYVLFTNGNLTAFGTIRKCEQGYKVGPLFAQNSQLADQLLAGLQNHAQGEQVYLDIPETNLTAKSLIEKYAMEEVFSCARMYLGNKPQIKENQIFGVTTFELG